MDIETAEKVRRVILLSRTRGIDPATMLDQAGLIDHPRKKMAYTAETLTLIIDMAGELTPTELGITSTAGTAMDMKNCMIAWLQEMRRSVQAAQ